MRMYMHTYVHLIVVTWAQVFCLICTPESRGPLICTPESQGPQARGMTPDEGVHIRQNTNARVTTIT